MRIYSVGYQAIGYPVVERHEVRVHAENCAFTLVFRNSDDAKAAETLLLRGVSIYEISVTARVA